MKKITIITSLTIFIIIGIFLRFNIFGNSLLWNDEAETTINSLQILENGYPNDQYNDKPLYENDSYIETNDSKYALASTNYYNSKFERNKGWLTFYYQAIFIKFFGHSPIIYRLPFIMIFPFSLILLYILAKKIFNEHTGLLAALIYSTNYYSIFYEGQARYYSLTIFLSLLCLYFFYLTVLKKNWKNYFLSSLALILLFYTHLVTFLALGLFFLAIHLYDSYKLRSIITKKVIFSFLTISIFTLPWIILVKFWSVARLYNDSSIKILWLLIVILVGLTYWLLTKVFPQFKGFFKNKLSGLNYLILFLIFIILFKPLLAPPESMAARLLIESLPILCILFSYAIVQIIKNKKITLPLGSGLVILLIIFFVINGPLKNSKNTYDTKWVEQSIAYLNQQNVDDNSLILLPYQHFSFMLHTDFNVELIWPLRKSYVDDYPGKIYLIYNKYQIWPKYTNGIIDENNIINFGDRTNECQQVIINNDTYSIECPPLVN